ncbi:uncharacterized protein SCHCODRAFT_02522037 [Schizophyllum commune H4-8]|nr:uncharacterized protein SCHCODRAFT_02522037 [Schizophyllum commune H4-8]KAI5836658.1 hypothetical protein SCHCODRAFT_02522037 [Schizophyllum commune H4-8]
MVSRDRQRVLKSARPRSDLQLALVCDEADLGTSIQHIYALFCRIFVCYSTVCCSDVSSCPSPTVWSRRCFDDHLTQRERSLQPEDQHDVDPRLCQRRVGCCEAGGRAAVQLGRGRPAMTLDQRYFYLRPPPTLRARLRRQPVRLLARPPIRARPVGSSCNITTWTFDSLLTRGAALVMFCQFLLMLMKESSSSHDAAGGRENGGRHQAESTLPLRETAIGGWGEEAYDPTLTAMHLAGGPGEPPAVGGERLPHAALLFAAAADMEVLLAPARLIGWDNHNLLVHLHLPVLLLLTRLLSRPANLQHPLTTDWRRLEELFRLDSTASVLIGPVRPRTLDIVAPLITDLLRDRVKASRKCFKLGSSDLVFAHTVIRIAGELRGCYASSDPPAVRESFAGGRCFLNSPGPNGDAGASHPGRLTANALVGKHACDFAENGLHAPLGASRTRQVPQLAFGLRT